MSDRLGLHDVTLCAVTSVNVGATIRALQHSLNKMDFHSCILLTDAPQPVVDKRIEVRSIARIRSSEEYSRFILKDLARHISTSHCLVAQWDGFVLKPDAWNPGFLEYDYVGARWPQFADGRDVGNGGFSLRSRRLLDACRSRSFHISHPEDLAIGRRNRAILEQEFGIRFASAAEADAFSAERLGDPRQSFGFHGVFNLIPALGRRYFWEHIRSLDHAASLKRDAVPIAKQILGLSRP